MKKIGFFLIAILLISCSKQSSDYVTISGLIANNDAKKISIGNQGQNKMISLNLDGTFSDSLKVVKEGRFSFSDGRNKAFLYLKNGNNIEINYDYSDFQNTIGFTGNGFESSQYLIEKNKFELKEKLNNPRAFISLEESVFTTRISYLENKLQKMLSNNKLDSTLITNEKINNKRKIDALKKVYQQQNALKTALAVGEPSPKFINYENYKGGSTSLDDLKGKYVYVDVWATWCGPCKREIPHLQKIEKEYHNKNIEFVSISVDDARRNGGSWDNAKDKWKKMIKDKKMGGMQLFADKGFQSDFIRGYSINGIPRFILIDPQGNIVNANAPRPSQPSLKNLLNTLKL